MGDYQNFNETKRCFDDKKGYCYRFEMIEQNKNTSTNTFVLALCDDIHISSSLMIILPAIPLFLLPGCVYKRMFFM